MPSQALPQRMHPRPEKPLPAIPSEPRPSAAVPPKRKLALLPHGYYLAPRGAPPPPVLASFSERMKLKLAAATPLAPLQQESGPRTDAKTSVTPTRPPRPPRTSSRLPIATTMSTTSTGGSSRASKTSMTNPSPSKPSSGPAPACSRKHNPTSGPMACPDKAPPQPQRHETVAAKIARQSVATAMDKGLFLVDWDSKILQFLRFQLLIGQRPGLLDELCAMTIGKTGTKSPSTVSIAPSVIGQSEQNANDNGNDSTVHSQCAKVEEWPEAAYYFNANYRQEMF